MITKQDGRPRRLGISGNVSMGSIILLVLLGAVGCFAYFRFVEPRLDAKKFEPSLAELGASSLEISQSKPRVRPGEMPYRSGKVLVVTTEHTLLIFDKEEYVPAKIHPTWYKLSRKIRASNPEEIDTLIRISKEIRSARLYKKVGGVESKVVSTHKVMIDVYDWYNQDYIGRWTLDPGEYHQGEMVEEDYLDKMIEATSDSTILDLIRSMPEQ
jgi:hypothetical protein